ncbi:hypothetical protein SAMD00023353_2100250 [Rosellinia necatrix]|uniref:Uncharacterized protein n=1 Tax=Rosellinia necatrix TaxID=77044 RepID=A0A1W2TFK4_ROSNE|nr:hypothetical protein SAMD00023353_2100250 [Rosellinia necatrix]
MGYGMAFSPLQGGPDALPVRFRFAEDIGDGKANAQPWGSVRVAFLVALIVSDPKAGRDHLQTGHGASHNPRNSKIVPPAGCAGAF